MPVEEEIVETLVESLVQCAIDSGREFCNEEELFLFLNEKAAEMAANCCTSTEILIDAAAEYANRVHKDRSSESSAIRL